ncbi:MAG: catalase [Ktedonobacterales bacterium]
MPTHDHKPSNGKTQRNGNATNKDGTTQEPTLTTRQGHPIANNHDLRTVGVDGPATLENYQFIEKITHFDRERIPERVVHARGAGAHGEFEAYGSVGDEPIANYTRAKLFQQKGKKTPLFVRFSTVTHGGHSPETARDPRGFAVKFYTEDGNWDLVGNNLKVFFIRDAMKFPDVVHAWKPDPVTNTQDPRRQFDFASLMPEIMHMLTYWGSPWGLPADFRHMNGAGVNTYKWINARGEAVLVKYHWVSQQGVRNLTMKEATEIQGRDWNHATRDLHDAIERGDFPRWEMQVQIMADGDHPELDFDPLDDTKEWPADQFPMRPVGMMTLNKNPENYFAEVEQVAFGTGVLVDGLDFSDDKMLQGRTLSYSDTQRYRVGPNYLQLPVNRPHVPVATNQRDGQMTYYVDAIHEGENPHVNYEPSSLHGLRVAQTTATPYTPHVAGNLVKQPVTRGSDFKQAGQLWRSFADWEKDETIGFLVPSLKQCTPEIQQRMVRLYDQCDEEYGRRVAEGLGLRTPVRAAEPSKA